MSLDNLLCLTNVNSDNSDNDDDNEYSINLRKAVMLLLIFENHSL